MLKKVLVVLGSVVCFLSIFGIGGAEELKTEPFLYTQDFEGEVDPVKFWCSNGEYTVNFKGLTEEKAFSGKKSFKLDVTVKKGSYFYWQIPLPPVPAEGRLKLSGRIIGGKLGCNFYIAPDISTGTGRWSGTADAGEWRLVEADLIKRGKQIAAGLAPRFAWGAEAGNVGIYVDKIGIYGGRKGQRVVVYVDDLKIEGEIPAKADYAKEVQRRWSLVKERAERKLSYWEDCLGEMHKSVTSMKDTEKNKELLGKINSLIAGIHQVRKRGILRVNEWKNMSSSVKEIKKEISDLE
ncbi:MAG: hypothetical protein KAX20_04430 [Candidatus Omnitrophica bacterium]|nr:hypothetical protein [Candidatus Omnitrophota bacterium]